MRFLMVDHEGSFSKEIVARWEKQGHEVIVQKTLDPAVAASADLIFCEWLDKNAIALTNTNQRWAAKTVGRMHRYEYEAGFLEKIQFDRFSDVIFVSPTWRKKAEEKYPGLRKTRVHTIPNGVDLSRFSWHEHGHGNVVGIVGILRPLSQPDLIIQIANLYPDMKFRIAGQWANWMNRGYVKQWEKAKPPNIEWCGWLPKEEMPAFYEGLNYYLNTKSTECFGFGVAEAMARGIKPIIYKGEGITDHWPDWLIWKNLEELDALFKGPYESKRYRKYVERYSLDKMLNSIDALIAEKRPLVSLTMIAKNEAPSLEKAVASVRPYVDEVVIGVDDKSSDETLEIAKRVGDEVYEFQFEDFAQARNLACDHAHGDWWMCLDAHETFEGTDDFKSWMRTCPGVAVDVTVNMDKDQFGIPSLTFLFPRICRWWTRWTRGVHNIPAVEGPGTVRRDWQTFHHRGEQKKEARTERDQQRKSMNVWTLRQDIKKNPKDTRALFYLANSYRELAEWLCALSCYQEQLKHEKWREQSFWCRLYSAQCLVQLDRVLEAKQMVLASLHDDPIRAEPYAFLGDIAYKAQNFREAAHWFHIAAMIPYPANARLFVQSQLYTNGGENGAGEGAVGRLALDKESMSRFHLGDYAGALRCAELVYEIKKDPRIANNIAQFKKALEKQQQEKK